MYGVFFDFDTIISSVYTYSLFGSNIVKSATFPSAISPLSIPNREYVFLKEKINILIVIGYLW